MRFYQMVNKRAGLGASGFSSNSDLLARGVGSVVGGFLRAFVLGVAFWLAYRLVCG